MDKAPGFTLIELLVVIAIMTVTLAVVGPRLAGRMEGAALRDGAADLQTLANSGRGRAALTGRPVALLLSADGRRIRLVGEQTKGGGPSWEALTRTRSLPQGVEARLSRANRPEAARATISFQPDGSVEAAELVLRDQRGEELRMETVPALGRLRVTAQP